MLGCVRGSRTAAGGSQPGRTWGGVGGVKSLQANGHGLLPGLARRVCEIEARGGAVAAAGLLGANAAARPAACGSMGSTVLDP
jgi:hypothetical protein